MPPEVLDRPETYISNGNIETGLLTAERFFESELDLPIMAHGKLIKDAIRKNDTLILAAETGSGKSAAGPVLILNELIQDNPHARIAITEQRRPAIVGLAEFVGKHVGSDIVAYQHKQKNTITSSTQMVYTMEGTLLNQISKDPLLMQYDCVVLDEVHERTVNLDLLTPLLKQAQVERQRRGLKRLKIVMTSATLDKEKLGSYFQDAAYLEVPGRTFPVERHYLEKEIDSSELIRVAAENVIEILKDEQISGHVMVFMPGKYEISKTREVIEQLLGERADIELFELMGGNEGSDTFKKILESLKRKVIVGSDVMKASLTIPGVEAVVIPGKTRVNVYDKQTELTYLRTLDATIDDIEQYIGRAGRTKPGHAYLLMTKQQHDTREQRTLPELLRTDLSAQVLKIIELGIDLQTFDFIDQPDAEELSQARAKLQRLGAIDEHDKLTDIGEKMLAYDTNPNFARMLVEAEERECLEEVALIVSLMDQKSIFTPLEGESFTQKYKDFVSETSDPLTLLNIWNEYVDHNEDKDDRRKWGEENAIRTRVLFNAFGTTTDILRKNGKRKPEKFDLTDEKKEQISLSVLSGLLDRVAKKNRFGTYDLISGKKQGIKMDRQSVLSSAAPDMFTSANLRTNEKTKKTFAGMNMAVTRDMISKLQPDFNYNIDEIVEEPILHEPKAHIESEEVTPEQKTDERPDSYAEADYSATPTHHSPQNHEQKHVTESGDTESPQETSRIKKIFRRLTSPFRKFMEFVKRNKKSGHH